MSLQDMSNRERIKQIDGHRPPAPIVALLLTIPLVLIQSVIAVVCFSTRRLLRRSDLTPGEDLTRSLMRGAGTAMSTPVMRYLISSPDTDQYLSSPHFQPYRSNMCRPLLTTDFSGFWVCRNFRGHVGDSGQTKGISRKVTLFWIHGGAYVIGHALSELPTKLRIAEVMASHGIELDIFSLSYSLAPEATFPIQEREAVAAYQYLINVEKIRPKNIVLLGESAGGHLALSFLLALQQNALPKPGGALFMYPWVNLLNSGASFAHNKSKCILVNSSLDRSVDDVVGGRDGRKRWSKRLDYTIARGADSSWKSVLPDRTWVNVGSHDVFLDDIQAFCHNAARDGAAIELEVTKCKTHGWQLFEDKGTESRYCFLGPDEDVPAGLMLGSQNLVNGMLEVLKDG
ncbi:Alpha/Beta hydrolase protein [Pyrenochaeta sp. MPI-SDFR-AT-0127]|nr:Alpha/Beta hydrolase protein [Pyrenochaeta sp. MPI-SDFR-AT-0127]